MREELLDLARKAASPALAIHRVREYLQARILLALQEAGAMIPLAFQGGTALRFLFDLPRFSEDLDFALERPDRSGFDLEALEGRITAQRTPTHPPARAWRPRSCGGMHCSTSSTTTVRPSWLASSTPSSSGGGRRGGTSSTSSGT